MAKSINLDRIKSELEKGELHQQIGVYTEIGEWLHDKITEEREAGKARDEKLKSIQEKLHTKNEGA
jgi:hypothetical protein